MPTVAIFIAGVCTLALPVGGIALLARWFSEVRRFANFLFASYAACLLVLFLTISESYGAALVFLVLASICLVWMWPRNSDATK